MLVYDFVLCLLYAQHLIPASAKIIIWWIRSKSIAVFNIELEKEWNRWFYFIFCHSHWLGSVEGPLLNYWFRCDDAVASIKYQLQLITLHYITWENTINWVSVSVFCGTFFFFVHFLHGFLDFICSCSCAVYVVLRRYSLLVHIICHNSFVCLVFFFHSFHLFVYAYKIQIVQHLKA